METSIKLKRSCARCDFIQNEAKNTEIVLKKMNMEVFKQTRILLKNLMMNICNPT